jgi:hypothetical protein
MAWIQFLPLVPAVFGDPLTTAAYFKDPIAMAGDILLPEIARHIGGTMTAADL